jgi:ABC-type thiamine transport system ATPase subunit
MESKKRVAFSRDLVMKKPWLLAKKTFPSTSYQEKRNDILIDLCNEKGQNPFALPFS